MSDHPPYGLVVFDFDGTLADTRHVITGAVARALEELAYPALPENEIAPLIGLPLAEMCAGIVARLPPGPYAGDALLERYRAIYREVGVPGTRLVEGVRTLLDELKARSIPLAIATSKSRVGLDRTLEALALSERFAHTATHDDVSRGKPHPEMVERILKRSNVAAERTVVVGDTSYDVEMGRAAGAHTCAVAWGVHPRETLEAVGPSYIVDTVEALGKLLLRAD